MCANRSPPGNGTLWDKYGNPAWNRGREGHYTISSRRRWSGGSVEFCAAVDGGVMTDAAFFGDFLSVRPLDGLVQALRGCPFLPVTCRNGDRQARMYVKFDTGSAGYFHFSYADSGDAPPPLWFIDSLRWADGYASAIGWTNRNRVNSHFRGTIPRFEIQGTAIADMPVKRTFGHNRILGCKLFDWGQVVLDFRCKRFLFIPRGGEAKAPPQPACNFTLALSAGQLVVGQVWDEALADVIAPGDRILSLDGHPWDGDVCRFLLDPDPLDGTVCGIGTASGQHVVLTIETMK